MLIGQSKVGAGLCVKCLEFAECILQVKIAVNPLYIIHVGAVRQVTKLVLNVIRTARDILQDVPHENRVKVVNLGVTGMVVCVPQLGDLEAV